MDFEPPLGQFMIQAGSNMACLDYTVEADNLFEEEESFEGELTGVVLAQGVIDPNPDRITLNPTETVINIADDPTDSECSDLEYFE